MIIVDGDPDAILLILTDLTPENTTLKYLPSCYFCYADKNRNEIAFGWLHHWYLSYRAVSKGGSWGRQQPY